MVSIKLLIIVLSLALGSIIAMNTTVNADYQNIGISPTNAMQNIEVQTSPWADTDTLVTADTWDQKIYLVSDGSITFNVTEAYNSTHAFGP